jgi:hypothetical protein
METRDLGLEEKQHCGDQGTKHFECQYRRGEAAKIFELNIAKGKRQQERRK